MKHKPSKYFFVLSTAYSLLIGLGIGGLTPGGMAASIGLFGMSCELLSEIKDIIKSLNQPKEEEDAE